MTTTQQQTSTPAQQRGAAVLDMPLAGREAAVEQFTRAAAGDGAAAASLATAKLIFSAGAAVRRFDWYRERWYNERLVVDERAIRMDRFKRGLSVLNSHNGYSLSAVLGVAESPVVRDGVAECDAKFSRRDDVAGYVRDIEDGVIRHVSVGYVRHRIEMVAPAKETDLWEYRVVDWEPMEVSMVAIPADRDCQARAHGEQPAGDAARVDDVLLHRCEFVEAAPAGLNVSPPTAATRAATETREEPAMSGNQAPQGGAPATTDDVAARAAAQAATQAAERTRSADIIALCVRHGMAAKATEFVTAGKTVDEVRAFILDTRAAADEQQGNGQRNVSIETVSDEMQVRIEGMQEALQHRVMPSKKLSDNGRQYRGHSLLEMGREYLEARGVKTRGMTRMDLAGKILSYRSGTMSTSDFPHLLANVANNRLRQAYDENNATFALWARKAPNAPDFKAMKVTNLGGAPDLLQVNEAGEFKLGGLTDGAETYSMLTYGRIVSFTRQAIVNDDLRGFDRLMSAFGNSARRLENRTVYGILTANAALADTGALFNNTAVTTAGGHANLPTAAAISVASLTAARAAMRLQKGLQSEELNITPRYLIVPAALEQVAYQFTSANYVPATPATINEFRAGGRTALEPIVEAVLDAASATAWYLAADSGGVDTVEYCYLDGNEGPVIDSEVGFDTDGVSYRCRHDFAAKAIDFRGLLKNAGA
jgi:hypothetical protein